MLFSDIRNFTPLVESIEPEQAVSMLNDYFTRMVDIVFRYGGTLDKFLGDGMMVVFGAPLALDRAEARAIAVALEMSRVMDEFNEHLKREGFPRSIDIGVGVATGAVVAGNIGSPERMEYTCIGDTVNYAARLEAGNKVQGSRILVCHETWTAAGMTVTGRRTEPFQVKGKKAPVQPWVVEPDGLDDEEMRRIRLELAPH